MTGWPNHVEGEDDISLHNCIVLWCDEHISRFNADSHGIYFFTDEDAMAYKLRWE